MITLVGIALKRAKRAPMEVQENGFINYMAGLEGEHRGNRKAGSGTGKRQVTVISEEQWREACAELGIHMPWHTRRAQLCVSGITFGPENVGRRIEFGTGALLEITGETEPCERMDEIHPGLQAALSKNWRGGVTCRVENSGLIKINDELVLV